MLGGGSWYKAAVAVTVGGTRRPQDAAGAQEASGSLRRHQETPGRPRTRKPREV